MNRHTRKKRNMTARHSRIQNVISKVIVLFFVCTFILSNPMAAGITRADDAAGEGQAIEQPTEEQGTDAEETAFEDESGKDESGKDEEAVWESTVPETKSKEENIKSLEDNSADNLFSAANDAKASGRADAVVDTVYGDNQEIKRSVSITVNGRRADEEHMYNLYTGEGLTYTIAIANEDNAQLVDVIRVYFDYSGIDYGVGAFPVADKPYTLRNSSGTEYTMKVVQCKDDEGNDMPGKFYYEITGIKPGETLAFQNDVLYYSPESEGGTLKIWTTAISQEHADTTYANKYIPPETWVEAEWTTVPVSFNIAKSNANSINNTSVVTHFEGDGSGNDTVYLKNLGYSISESYDGSTGIQTGKDYVRTIDYSDVLTLPDSTHWDEGILNAIKNGEYTVKGEVVRSVYNSGYYGYSIYVTVNGQQKLLLSLQDRSYQSSGNYKTNGIKNLLPKVVTGADGRETLEIDWYCDNPYKTSNSASAEDPARQFSLVYGDSVIAASVETLNQKMDAGENPVINNKVDENRHYSWSEDQSSTSNVNKTLALDASMETGKYWTHYNYSGTSTSSIYGGGDSSFYLVMKNTGIANISDWGITDENGAFQSMISDELTYYLYITPEDIEKMFSAQLPVGQSTYNVGNWLTMTISNATFCTVDAGRETSEGQELYAEDQSDKYLNSNPSTDRTALTNTAKMVLKNEGGVLKLTVSDSGSSEKDGTYTIGSTGDYATLDAAFKALGFEVTSNTRYKVDYQPLAGDNFVLRSGQTFNLTVPATMKTTPMMIDGDTESNRSSTGYDRNRATFRARYAEENHITTKETTRRYWSPELFLYKNGYIAASKTSISGSDTEVPDGSLIDYNVYFYRYNQRFTSYFNTTTKAEVSLSSANYVYEDTPYDSIPVSDLVSGPQVVLVSKTLNPDLTAPDGSALQTQADQNGNLYWMLNKPGIYENVIIGTNARIGSSTAITTNYTAATITVTEQSNGLNTVLKWEPLENWGGRRRNADGSINTNDNSGTTNIFYKVLVSGKESGAIKEGDTSGQKYTLNNKCWLGDHQRHRLYDTLGGHFWVYGFDKYISTGAKDGTDEKTDGTLIKSNRIRKGDTITYQMMVTNRSEGEVVLTGASIFDALPQTRGQFEWIKNVNVKNLRYVTDGATVRIGGADSTIDTWDGGNDGSWQNGIGDDHWSIQNEGKTSSQVTNGQYYIIWDDDVQFAMTPGGTVKILVDLEFPAEGEGDTSVWANFVNANNGQTLYNTFYLGEQNAWRSDNVSHLPLADGKAVLRKGVYETGWTAKDGRNLSWGYGYHSRDSRKTYANSGYTAETNENFHASTVTYYTEVYNGSNERLYLEPLQDKLPKGFTFNSMTNLNYNTGSDWDGANDGNGYIGYLSRNRRSSVVNSYTEYGDYSEDYKLSKVDNSDDETDNHKVIYVNARVTTSTAMKGENQYITFTISNSGCSSYTNHPAIGYDSIAKRYYLDPGQAVRFAYDAVAGTYSQTEDVAINTIAMPYYNYYDTDFEMDDVEKLKPSTRNGLEANDGDCQQMTTEAVKKAYNFDTSAYENDDAYGTEEEGNWLVSYVAVDRTDFIPGIQKTVQGHTAVKTNPAADTIQGSRGSDSALYGTPYTGGVRTSDIVNWRVRVFAEENSMINYKVEDVMDDPYLFTGQVFFNSYKKNGTSTIRETSNSVYLFTLGNRTEGDTKVRINSGSSISASSRMLNIGSAENDSDDDWFVFGTGDRIGRVKIEKLEDGREKMTIELTGPAWSIAANSYLDFCIHTQFCRDVIVISEGKFNDAIVVPNLDYRPSAVTKGRALTHTETIDGKKVTQNDGVESGASVMIVQGYTTTAYKKITELDNTSNTARSDASPNFISLSERDKAFRYDCYVTGPQAVMSKIVLIDALPQEGDHSAFVDSDKRFSDFMVKLYNNEFHAYLKKKGKSEIELSADEFTVEGNLKTEFTTADWNGKGNGWVNLKDLEEEDLQKIRSIRLIINDPNAWQWNDTSLYKMPDETVVHFSFNAHIDDPEAVAGEYAWNSFGYYYTVPQTFNGTEENSIGISLMAQPLNVGVRYPAAPELTKRLVDKDGNDCPTEMDLTFNFLIYKGDNISSLDNALEMEEADIAELLERAQRDYIVVPLTVKKGSHEAKISFWNTDYMLADYDGGWITTDDPIHWIQGEQFNLVELPMGNYRYTLEGINGQANNLTFIQDISTVLTFEVVNTQIENLMEVRGHKVWEDADNKDKIRPDSIEVNLLADGIIIDSAKVNNASDWRFAFTDLPRFHEDGSEIQYDIQESFVDGYTVTYSVTAMEQEIPKAHAEGEAVPAEGVTEAGDTQPEEGGSQKDESKEQDTVYTLDYTVTNKHIPKPPAASDDIETGDRANALPYLIGALGALVLALTTIIVWNARKKKDN